MSSLPPRPNPTPRDIHYGEFYGLKEFDGDTALVVVGNCQAESLRIVLSDVGPSFRIPPVHEWEPEDMPYVTAAIERAGVLVCQPIRDDYRGLPAGTNQLARYAKRVVLYPVMRFNALNPYLAIVRPPSAPSLDPPVVPYHDLRILTSLTGYEQVREPDYGAILEDTVHEMRIREDANGSVRMSDYLRTFPIWHTLNHPDNATMEELGRRVLSSIDPAANPSLAKAPADRQMLGNLRSPIDAAAARHFGVDVSRPHWLQGGHELPYQDIVAAQTGFYANHPDALDAGITRHAELLDQLGFVRKGA